MEIQRLVIVDMVCHISFNDVIQLAHGISSLLESFTMRMQVFGESCKGNDCLGVSRLVKETPRRETLVKDTRPSIWYESKEGLVL